MKLKESPRPNCCNTKSQKYASVPFSLILLTLLSVTQPIRSDGELAATNEIPNSSRWPQRDVTNLRLLPDYRSVGLRWTHEHEPQEVDSKPAAFSVRYCELTSWNVEIKCRQRDLPVDSQQSLASSKQQQQQTDNGQNSIVNNTSSVIRAPLDVVHQLEPPNGVQYETQIYDLRALTNYTFHVKVSRFANEPQTIQPMPSLRSSSNTVGGERTGLARRLDSSFSNNNQLESNQLSSRIETKAFGAEASKCLANISEVLIQTGKFFGGRISVENSVDPRCQLVGNKSSEQSTYLFRIHHDACHSKLVDGNRIETMVLVHENKDILTHNTARFLVLCNIQQKSFTLKASISLPKVQGAMGPTRAAVITPISANQLADSQLRDKPAPFMLGSMPGLYRARQQHHHHHQHQQQQQQEEQSSMRANKTLISGAEVNRSQRHSNEMLWPDSSSSNNNTVESSNAYRSRARALSLPAQTQTESIALPRPVEVQSKMLFVEHSNGDRRAKVLATATKQPHHNDKVAQPQQQTIQLVNPLERSSGQLADHALGGRSNLAKSVIAISRQSSAALTSEQLVDDSSELTPIIMTNNHRVTGGFLPLANKHNSPSLSSRAADTTDQISNYSIRYSTAKVDEYSLDRDDQSDQANSSRPGARSGRMRVMNEQEPSMASAADDSRAAKEWTVESRMGEVLMDSPIVDSSSTLETIVDNRTATVPQMPNANSTSLAQNITSYLLRWSLKALTNLARKSLESLAKDEENNASISAMNNDSNMKADKLANIRWTAPIAQVIITTTTTKPPQIATTISTDVVPTTKRPLEPAKTSIRPIRTTEESIDNFVISKEARTDETKPMIATTTKVPAKSDGNQARSATSQQPLSRRRGGQHLQAQRSTKVEEESAKVNENMAKEPHIANNWITYGIPILFMLVTTILVAICLIISPIGSGHSHLVERRIITPASFFKSNHNQTPSEGPIYPNNHHVVHETCPPNYNGSNELSRQVLIKTHKSNPQQIVRQMSPSFGSQTTRSTSAASSSSIGDEHNCKNSEFVYTDHVLINVSASGESFA